MDLLRLYLPQGWSADQPCPWALLDERCVVRRSGVDRLDAWPQADDCELVLDAAAVLLTRAELPAATRRKAGPALAYAIEDQLSGEPEASHVAAGPVLASGETALAVVDKAWLRAVRQAMERHGRRVVRGMPEALLLPLAPGAWSVVWRGSSGCVRTGETSGFAFDAESDAPPAALALALEDARAHGTAPRELRVSAVEGAIAPDCAAWQQALGLPVVAAGAWTWKDAPRGPLDLLQGEFAAKSARPLLPRMRVAAGLAVAIVLVQAAGTAADWYRLAHEKRQLRSEMEAVFRAAFPDAHAVVDAPLQMQRQLDELRRAQGQAGADDFPMLLAQVAPRLGLAPGSVRTLEYDSGRLVLDVQVAAPGELEALRQRLRGLARVEDARAVDGGTRVRFSVTGGKS